MRSRELSGFRAVGPLWVLLCCTTPRIVLGSLFSWAPRPPGAAAGPSGPRRARSPCIEVAHGKRFLKPRGVLMGGGPSIAIGGTIVSESYKLASGLVPWRWLRG